MVTVPNIVFFDLSTIMAMLVIASLSKTIGEALKYRPFYILLYYASIVVAIAALADCLPPALKLSISPTITMVMRCIAGLVALPVCLKYWKWVISEFFKN